MTMFMLWLRLLGLELYTLSTYFSDLSALGPLKSDSDEWWHLGFGWLQWRLRQRSCCGFLSEQALLLLMQGVGSGALGTFSDILFVFVHHSPMYK
jgi:hypothetical protein